MEWCVSVFPFSLLSLRHFYLFQSFFCHFMLARDLKMIRFFKLAKGNNNNINNEKKTNENIIAA